MDKVTQRQCSTGLKFLEERVKQLRACVEAGDCKKAYEVAMHITDLASNVANALYVDVNAFENKQKKC